MKNFKKLLVLLVMLALVATLMFSVACNDPGDSDTGTTFTVTYMVEGAQYGQKVTVQKGRRISAPADPTFTTQGYVFTGWYTDSNFAEGTEWNFTTGIVTADLTLYAGYRVVSEAVSAVAMADEACTSKIVWTQAAASEASAYEIIISTKSGSQNLTGTVQFDSDNYEVTFIPDDIPQGGKYTLSVKDTTKSAEAVVVENVLFGGEGTEANPYLIGSAKDFTKVNQANVDEGVVFQLADNITIETSRELQKDFVFNGKLIGKGRTITLENSNTAAIYKVGEKGYVYNVNVAGSVSTALFDSIATIADYNAGKIEKINSTANVDSTAGLAGSNGLANALNAELADGAGNRGIAGGIVGTNLATGTVYNCKITTSSSSTGTVKANIAGGTIVGLNYGKIEMCISNGCFGAWNSTESGGKTLSRYSYAGGITGINAGTVTKCSVSGSAKLLAQRYEDAAAGDAAAGTTNSNIGGIVGYNMKDATVSECYFAGIRVHADENVGGIAGLNAGTITDSYVKGAYSSTTYILSYIGGRKNIGGIVGKSEATGTVNNCFVTANVYAYSDATTVGTAYAVAENATNSVYLSANPNKKSVDKNPDGPVTLTAPQGSNVAVTVEANSYDGQTVDFALAESYLSTINGNDKFEFNGTTIVLKYESDVIPEETMEVTLYKDGAEHSTVTVAETGKAIDGPTKKGYVFTGWSLVEGGEIKFAKGAPVSLYDLQDYVNGEEKVILYANYEVRVPNEGLIVAVWERYVDATVLGDIKTAYETYMANNNLTYTVEFRVYEGTASGTAHYAVKDFGTAVNNDGDIDVIIGAGTNISSQGGVEYIARANLTHASVTGRLAVLLTDTERAIDFYAFATGIENANANVTFVTSEGSSSSELNSVFANEAEIPEVDVQEGFEFLGWATTQNATEAHITATTIKYATVKDLLVDGAVTLYPVIVAIIPEPEPEPNPTSTLKVSVWTKGGSWVTADELDAIKTGFNAYLTSKSYDLANVTIEWVETVTDGNKVADLGAAVNAAGDFDFVIGCGNNIDSSAGVTIVEKADVVVNYVAAGRMCARLTDNVLATELFAYLTTAPQVETYSMKVSVWTKGGTWVTADELDAIKTGFNAYLTSKSYDLANVTIEWVETVTDGNKVADLGAAVNAAGDFDIIIGCGNNINSSGGVTIAEKADVLTSIVSAERMCARLTGNVLATELFAYLTTAQA